MIDQVDRERGANRNQSRGIQFIHAERLTHHPNTRYTLLVMAPERVEDHSILQQDLLNLEQWASLWQMNFAPSKCYTLSVTLKKQPSPSVYSLCDSNLEGVKFENYLGVYISSTDVMKDLRG